MSLDRRPQISVTQAASTYSADLAASLPDMTTKQALSLHEALRTLIDVLNALSCQPRFNAGDALNPAGEWLSQLTDDLAAASEEAVNRASRDQPQNKFERLFWAETLIRHAASRADSVEEIAEFAQSLAARRS